MNANLLYFPYINIPETSWTYRALLYYDTIATIVPKSYIYGDGQYEKFMQMLVDGNLVRPIDPIEVFRKPWELTQAILAYIQLPQYGIDKKRMAFATTLPTAIPLYRISGEKFSHGLLNTLEHEGLAARDDGNFFKVEPVIGKLMMLILTNYVSQTLVLQPVTDSIQMTSVRFAGRGGKVEEPDIEKRRNKLLEGIMPGPEFINLNKLLDFKIKYSNLLYQFRILVESIAHDSTYDEAALMEIKIAELIDLWHELSIRMQERSFGQLVYSNVFTVGNLLSVALNIKSIGGALKAVSTLKNILRELTTNNEEFYDISKMKYLALVHKHL